MDGMYEIFRKEEKVLVLIGPTFRSRKSSVRSFVRSRNPQIFLYIFQTKTIYISFSISVEDS